MRGNDFKDALNELQLTKSFCEKMEKKLSETAPDNDGYYDEVVHVDVVPKRTKKSFAAAAALVLTLGVGGTGTALMFRDKITTELSVEEEDNDENSIDGNALIDKNDEDKCEFGFPFGRIDLNSLSFTYGYDHVFYNTFADHAQTKKLIRLFESIDWQVDRSYTDSDTSFFVGDGKIEDSDLYAADGFAYVYAQGETAGEGTERISFYTKDKRYNIYFLGDGMVVVNKRNDSLDTDEDNENNWYTYTYKVPVEKFQELKNIMFEDKYLGYIHSFSINADLNGATYRIGAESGKLSSAQAFDISNMINITSSWSLIGESTYIPDDAESISVEFINDNKLCDLEFIDYNNYLRIVESSLDGEIIRTRIYQADYNRYAYIKAIFCKGMELEFSPELGNSDHGFITVVKDGKVTGCRVSRESIDALLSNKSDMKWYMLSNKPLPSDYDAAVFFNVGHNMISFYNINGNAYCFDNEGICYRFEGFDHLLEWATEMPGYSQSDTEYVHQWINDAFSNDLQIINTDSKNVTYHTIEDAERLKQIFFDLDWECINSVKHLTDTLSPFLNGVEYNNKYTQKVRNDVKIKCCINNGTDIMIVQSNGVISSSCTGCVYKCSTPDKLISAIDELIKDSPKDPY